MLIPYKSRGIVFCIPIWSSKESLLLCLSKMNNDNKAITVIIWLPDQPNADPNVDITPVGNQLMFIPAAGAETRQQPVELFIRYGEGDNEPLQYELLPEADDYFREVDEMVQNCRAMISVIERLRQREERFQRNGTRMGRPRRTRGGRNQSGRNRQWSGPRSRSSS